MKAEVDLMQAVLYIGAIVLNFVGPVHSIKMCRNQNELKQDGIPKVIV